MPWWRHNPNKPRVYKLVLNPGGAGFSIQISERGGNGPPPMGGGSRGGNKSGRGGMARDADATI